MNAAPLFIVGAHRSGTTLVRLMLDSHPEIAIPEESHFIPRAYESRDRLVAGGRVRIERYLEFLNRQRRFRDWGLPIDAVAGILRTHHPEDLAQAVSLTFQAYAHKNGKQRWGDKTPDYVLSMPMLRDLFPRARFVHLIRDGRDVASSFLGRATTRNVWLAAFHWVTRVSTGRQVGRRFGAEHYLEIKYESLVADTEGTLRRICGFADLPFAPQMLEYGSRVQQTVPERRRHRWTRLASPVAPKLRDWRAELTPGEIEAFEAVAGGLLEELGYPLSGRRVSPITRVVARVYLLTAGVWQSMGLRKRSRWVRRTLGPAARTRERSPVEP